jgi:hypothetical protein
VGSDEAGSKLGWLIVGRLVSALLLSVVGTLWTGAGEAPSRSIKASACSRSSLASRSFTHSSFVSPKTFSSRRRFQLTVDIFLVTWLVWNSNVIQSPYVALYIVIIAISSLVSWTTRSGRNFGWMRRGVHGLRASNHRPVWTKRSNQLVGGSMSQTIQWVGLFDVAFLVVGLLSARLPNDNHVPTCV